LNSTTNIQVAKMKLFNYFCVSNYIEGIKEYKPTTTILLWRVIILLHIGRRRKEIIGMI